MARPRTSNDGARTLALTAPMASPIPAGSAAPPMADAATCRLTVRVVPVTSPAPTLPAVVRVSRGKTGAAARPTVIRPMTATELGPGTVISAAPRVTPAIAPPRTRDGPTRSATGPRTARPTNIIAQYADIAATAASCGRPRPAVRKT